MALKTYTNKISQAIWDLLPQFPSMGYLLRNWADAIELVSNDPKSMKEMRPVFSARTEDEVNVMLDRLYRQVLVAENTARRHSLLKLACGAVWAAMRADLDRRVRAEDEK